MHFDRMFWKSVLRIAIPVTIQQFITSFLNLVDVMMVGQLGDTAVAGVGLANQVVFLLTFFLFGTNSGSASLTAQLWGKKDLTNIRRVLILCLLITGFGGALFFTIAHFFPNQTMSFYSSDSKVIELGSRYLQINSIGYLMMAVSWSFSSILKSTGVVKPQMLISLAALGLKTILNFLLIFGNLGFPKMGTDGAALATVVARSIELAAMLYIVYFHYPVVAIFPSHFNGFKKGLVKLYLKTALPVTGNEILWGAGISAYNFIYAHISTHAVAAYDIVSSVENVAYVIFVGLSDACGILVGNKIGASKEKEAFRDAKKLLVVIIILALLMGVVIYFSREMIMSLYNVEEITRQYAIGFLLVSSCMLWIRSSLIIIIIGIFRAGGDTRFSFAIDAGSIWLIGVPMAAIGAFIWHLPPPTVYLLATAEEIIKLIICLIRVFSGKWIHNLADNVQSISIEESISG